MKIEYRDNEELRIDKFLSDQDIDELYSRTHVHKLIQKNFIKVNGSSIKKSYKLKFGDIIQLKFPPEKKVEVIPEKMNIMVLYEDEYLAIVNKPDDLAVHPAPGHPSGTLVNAIMHKFKGNLSSGSHKLRPGIVHRLDMDTSGAIIIAKDNRTHSLLSKMFQNREIEKIYRAIVAGEPKQQEATIKTSIDRSKTNRKKMTVAESGKQAITHYKIIGHYNLFSYLELNLETGRTHQIRVHLSHINCPILGDETYSSLKRSLSMLPNHYHKKLKYLRANHLKRQALHAYKIIFEHPINNKKIDVTAPIPEDMKYTLNWLNEFFGNEYM